MIRIDPKGPVRGQPFVPVKSTLLLGNHIWRVNTTIFCITPTSLSTSANGQLIRSKLHGLLRPLRLALNV